MPDPYKIILVDDEDEVRGRISSKITAESGFVVAGTAGNGYDALELIEKLAPQVVLTDIKMPYIDGIELAGIIRRDYPTVRIGFITGYDEFDYARQAIKLGVRSYLTKPLTQEDISASSSGSRWSLTMSTATTTTASRSRNAMNRVCRL
jgi:two-component system response regulator YesN